MRQDDVEVLARSTLHDVPAVTGAGCVMHYQRSDRAAPGRFLKLVDPASVKGHRFAAELAGNRLALSGFEVRIVDKEDGDLPFEIDALEIVPIALRRSHAIADENHR